MFTNKRNLLVISLSLIAIFAIGVFAAFAQDATATPPYGDCGMMHGQGGHGMMNGQGMMGGQGMMNGQGMMADFDSSEDPMFVAIASALSLSPDELAAELAAGKSIPDIATELNIDIQTVYDAALVAHDAHLAAQVEAGLISQEQADAMQTWMQSNISNLHIFNGDAMTGDCPMAQEMGGRGMMGHGMGHGMGRWGN